MNYAYLAKKYLGLKVRVHDRTWEGLEVIDGTKPTIEQFEAFQREEDRLIKINHEIPDLAKRSLMEERQHQARVKAIEDSISIEEKIRKQEEEIRKEITSLRQAAKEVSERQKTVSEMDDAWYEISKAQDIVNEEARTYLAETDWYYTREKETQIKVPEEVIQKRQEARDRIHKGELVFAKWQALRAKAMPSKEEIKNAILAGGEELERIKGLCQSAVLKYAKPKRKIF